MPKAWTAEDQNYYRPEARIEARMNKTSALKATLREDESVFKMPLIPRKSITKSRLSPKTVSTSENAVSNTSSSSMFESSNTTSSTQSGLFDMPMNQPPATAANNIFGSFNQPTRQVNLFGNNSSSNTSSESLSKANRLDLLDGGSSAFGSTNTAFGKMPDSGGAPPPSNLFSAFSQKSESPFAQVNPSSQPKPSLFGNATSTNATSIFGSFKATDSNQQTNQSGFVSQSNLFGGFKGTSDAMSGITPITDDAGDVLKQREREQQEAKLKEQQMKQQQELERKKKEDELEKQRQKAKEEEKRQKREQLERKRLEIEKASKEMTADFIDEYVSNSLNDIAAEQIQWYRAFEETVNKIYVELLHEVRIFL